VRLAVLLQTAKEIRLRALRGPPARQPTALDSPEWADELRIEARLILMTTPELNAIDHLRKDTKQETLGDWEPDTNEGSSLAVSQRIINLSSRSRLRRAGRLSENFLRTRSMERPASPLRIEWGPPINEILS